MRVDYRQCLATLKEVSFDDDNNISLIDDEQKAHRVYNFDGVSKKLCKKLRGEKNFSCDAYYVKREDDTYLIEFKNQPEGNIDQKKLKNKIYDSITTIVMNEDILPETVIQRTSVIIVYNNEVETLRDESSYSTSEYFSKFSGKLSCLANKQGLDAFEKKFKLVNYRGTLFKEVYTIDKADFVHTFIDYLFE